MIKQDYTRLAAALLTSLVFPGFFGRAAAQDPVPPPISVQTAQYFHDHPAARSAFDAQRARRPSGASATSEAPATPAAPLTSETVLAPLSSGAWAAVPAAPSAVGLCNPLLLTDGSVIMANCNTPAWYKLTPDASGNYVKGSWSQIASLPMINGTQYAPLYHASAVLPDGRVIIIGGEYNGSSNEEWTSLGAIYDPLANAWKAVAPPSSAGWNNTVGPNNCNGGIGDAASVVLPNGSFLLTAACAGPAVDALLDAATLGWTAASSPNAGGAYQDEQGYNLLSNDKVLTIDIWTNYPAAATNAEVYDPATGAWTSAGNTPVSLPDPPACGNWEIGPAVLRPDGTVVAFGGNTGCVSGATADPTAIYSSATGTWIKGPNVPAIGGQSFTLADAPGALLPDGNILFAASPGYGNTPTHFFEFTTANAIGQVADPIYFASSSGAYYYNFVVLPTGQILMTDFSNIAEVYTPVGTPNASWAPAITSVPTTLTPGASYMIGGTQLNGRSQGAAYGDDVQTATNYPLVQIKNQATGHVFYARTSGHSTMSVAPGAAGSTHFSVPAGIETGTSDLVVVANGIASAPVTVSVSVASAAVPTFSPAPGTYSSAQSVTLADATSGAVIHYTTDGSTPTTASPVYTAALKISVTTTVTAIAVATGLSESPPASATYTIVTATGPTSVNLASALNVDGIGTLGTPVTGGGIDGSGDAYGGALLGTSLVWSGATFKFAAPGAKSAVSGQVIALPAGNDASLSFLGTAVNGNQVNQSFVVSYADGTKQTFTQSLSNWSTPQHYAGETIVLTTAYKVTASGGTHAGAYSVFGYTFVLDPTKVAASLTLPANRNVIVLAVDVTPASGATGTPQSVTLAGVEDLYGIGTAGTQVTGGGLDGSGSAYAGSLLGTSLAWSGATYAFSAPGPKSAVNKATIPLPAGNDVSVSFLGAAVNGNQTGQTFVVTYTDATTTTYTQSLSNWNTPQNYPGESIAATIGDKITASGGLHAGAYNVYGYRIAVDSAKTVQSLTLPANPDVVVLAVDVTPLAGARPPPH